MLKNFSDAWDFQHCSSNHPQKDKANRKKLLFSGLKEKAGPVHEQGLLAHVAGCVHCFGCSYLLLEPNEHCGHYF